MSRCEACLSPTHETDACRQGLGDYVRIRVADLHRYAEASDRVDEAINRGDLGRVERLALAALDIADELLVAAQRQAGGGR